MKRTESPSRELWIAVGVSLMLHVMAGSVIWSLWERTIPDEVFMETEWTWTAPSPEQKMQGRTASVTSGGERLVEPAAQPGAVSPPASGSAGLKEASPAEKLPGGAAGTTTVPTTGPASGPGQAPNAPVTGGSTSGSSAAGGSTSSTGSPSGALQDSEGSVAGDSTGFALVPPKIRERPAIRLPAEAVQGGIAGNVLLLVEVLEDGRVGRIVVERSSGSKMLDEAARASVTRWRFDAAYEPQGKKPVRVMTSVWVRYTKEGS